MMTRLNFRTPNKIDDKFISRRIFQLSLNFQPSVLTSSVKSAVNVSIEEHHINISRNQTLPISDRDARILAISKNLFALPIVIALNLHPVWAEGVGAPSNPFDSAQPAHNPKFKDGISDRMVVVENGYEIHEAGVTFQPDESEVACFTKKGGFNTDDRGIHLTYIKRSPELYINYDFDQIANRYSVVFGNNFCRYTVTIQREIKVGGRWKLSTMLK